jgi:hypothetical protein
MGRVTLSVKSPIGTPPGVQLVSEGREFEQLLNDRCVTIFRVARIASDDVDDICVARSLSSDGITIEAAAQYKLGQIVRVSLVEGLDLEGHVIWQRDRMIGVGFEFAIDPIDVLQKSSMKPDGHTRNIPRLPVRHDAELRVASTVLQVEVCDISPHGARIKTDHKFGLYEMVWIELTGLEPICGTLRWRLEGHVGVEFATAIPITQLIRWLNGS